MIIGLSQCMGQFFFFNRAFEYNIDKFTQNSSEFTKPLHTVYSALKKG